MIGPSLRPLSENTHTTHKRHTSMSLWDSNLQSQQSERSQNHALNRAATGIDNFIFQPVCYFVLGPNIFPSTFFLHSISFYLRVTDPSSNVECFQLEQYIFRSYSSKRGNEHLHYIIHPVSTKLISLLKPTGYEMHKQV